jgi:hypothetical protein
MCLKVQWKVKIYPFFVSSSMLSGYGLCLLPFPFFVLVFFLFICFLLSLEFQIEFIIFIWHCFYSSGSYVAIVVSFLSGFMVEYEVVLSNVINETWNTNWISIGTWFFLYFLNLMHSFFFTFFFFLLALKNKLYGIL